MNLTNDEARVLRAMQNHAPILKIQKILCGLDTSYTYIGVHCLVLKLQMAGHVQRLYGAWTLTDAGRAALAQWEASHE